MDEKTIITHLDLAAHHINVVRKSLKRKCANQKRLGVSGDLNG